MSSTQMPIKAVFEIVLKNIAVAIAFFIGGKLGLYFAQPPGIVTMIWPASGIALVALLIWGRGVVLGIFIGSMLIQTYITLLYKFDGIFLQSLPIALAIAFGSTLQAILGEYLARKFCNFPNIFLQAKRIFLFLLLTGPVACLLAASVGNYTLWYTGIVPTKALADSWLAWWIGDSAGVILFVPTLYIVFGDLFKSKTIPHGIGISKNKNYGLRIMAILALCAPLSLTYYLWQQNAETDYEYKKADFLNLINESKENLKQRLLSYEAAMKAGITIFATSKDNKVTPQQWRKYSDIMDFPNNFAGINGVGYIAQVPRDGINAYVQEQIEYGITDFKIKPQIFDENYVVTYIEPIEYGRPAIGLNLAFEENRRNAAILSRDSGEPVLSQFIYLVQNEKNTPAFLLFWPMYKSNMPLDNKEQRNAAFNGWVNTAFIANKLFYKLSDNQSRLFRLRVYQNTEFANDKIVYDSNLFSIKDHSPKFIQRQFLNLYKNTITIEWASTPIFENETNITNSSNILIGGFTLTALLCMFMLFIIGRAQQVQQSVEMQTLELRSSQAELMKSEDTLRIAIEHAPIGMVLITPQGDWIRVNESAYQLFGYSPSELENIRYQDLMVDEHKAFTPQFYELLNKNINTYKAEKCIIHKLGHKIWLLISVSAIYKYDGSVEYVILQLEDITQRKEIDKIKSEFVSVVSHELRTPLTSIRGALGLITGALYGEISEKALHLAQMAQKNSDRLMMLVNDILDIEKIASGAMQFDLRNHDLMALVKQAIESNISYAAQFNIKMTGYLMNKPIYIRVDDNRFLQVLSNLISNAVKFSHVGGDVKITTSIVDGRARIAVQDFGAGMPPEFSEKIFGKFAQADSSTTRAKGGSGLGLHITKQIVENMQGSIDYCTKLGEGTTFWIDFAIVEILTPEKVEEQVT